MCIYVFLYNHVSGTFRYPSLPRADGAPHRADHHEFMDVRLGSLEIRHPRPDFSVYDLVFSLVAVTLVCLFVVSMLQAVRRLRREDCPRS